MFDWTVLNLQQEKARLPVERPILPAGGGDGNNPNHAAAGNVNPNTAAVGNAPNATHAAVAPGQDRTRDAYNTATANPSYDHEANKALKDVSQRSGSRGYGGKVQSASTSDPNNTGMAQGGSGVAAANPSGVGGGTATSGKRRTTEVQEYPARQPYHDGADRQQNNAMENEVSLEKKPSVSNDARSADQ